MVNGPHWIDTHEVDPQARASLATNQPSPGVNNIISWKLGTDNYLQQHLATNRNQITQDHSGCGTGKKRLIVHITVERNGN